ncbi:WD repeat protein-like protein [Myriangium duriaei CBS 260.36]|uniref:WD repeat protein-like protein n=1 Tax=Myriangium duriaei CBS 260.36 TaxID=1168546 RepID=A0A9P4IYQ1_9PEZI|nr:WD repeat protein-like protein [Myriangium duriaei CBS 260.36]
MQNILPGQPRAELHAVDHGYHEGQLVVAYLSGSSLVLLDGPQSVLQTIRPDPDSLDDLNVVRYHQATAKIAVATTKRIYVYGLREQIKGTLRWVRELVVRTEKDAGDIRTLSWGSDDELLVSTTQRLALYNTHIPSEASSPVDVTNSPKAVEPMWTRTLPSSVQYAELSPSASLIATVSQYDCLVKIWRRLTFELPQFDFAYLRHPAPVTHAEWRQVPDEDDVLFTICADGVFRVWKSPGAHSVEMLSLFAEINMVTAIQPRDPSSQSSINPRRYAFVLDSSMMEEAAKHDTVDKSEPNGQARHAHEYFQEIASRKADIVVITDDCGHMSAWGLESVGCKRRSTKPQDHATLFHINHLEHVHFNVLSNLRPEHSNTKLRGLSLPSSPNEVAVLAHHFDGRITWHQALVRDLLNPSANKHRMRRLATWTGHSTAIKKVIRTAVGGSLISRTDQNEGIVWRMTPSGSLVRRSVVSLHEHIHRVVLLRNGDFLVCLHHDKVTLWDCRKLYAKEVARCDYDLSKKPLCLFVLPEVDKDPNIAHLATVSVDMSGIVWELKLPPQQGQANGHAEHQVDASMREFCRFKLDAMDQALYVLPVDPAGAAAVASDFLDIFAHDVAMSYSATGALRTYTARIDRTKSTVDFLTTSTVETSLQNPSLGSATSIRRAALVDSTKLKLTIWDTRSGRLDHEEAFAEAIHDLDWASTPDNQSSLLAVGFSRQVLVYSQLRYDYVNDSPAWGRIKTVSLPDAPLPLPIADSVWCGEADLVVGAGNQLLVAPGTIDTTSEIASELRMAPPHRQATTLYQLARRVNGPLPVFHPQFITQCVLAGKLEVVHRVLLKLLQILKFYTEGDDLDPLLGFEVEDFVATEDDDPSLANSQHGMRSYNDDASSTVTDAVAQSLNELLTQKSIPQLTSPEQISLVSIIECVATVSTHSRSIDINASRFLLFWRSSLIRSHQRSSTPLPSPTPSSGISYREVVFAYHSSSQDILTNLILSSSHNTLSWPLARQSRLFTWLTSRETLLQNFDNLAKAAYTATEPRDPVACSLHYLALRKKPILVGLWRMATWSREQPATMRLLRNDFSEARWRSAAQKNAFALMGKRRFEYAAAFFLLADDLRSALGVIATQLQDVDLALAVGRAYAGDDCEEVRDLVTERILRPAVRDGDRWAACWALWFLGDRGGAVRALVEPLDKLVQEILPGDEAGERKEVSLRAKSFLNDDPALVVLYEFLRGTSLQTLSGAVKVSGAEERAFVMRTAGLLRRMGCDILALGVVRNWEFLRTETQRAKKEEKEEEVGELPPSPKLSRDVDPRKLLRRRSSLVVDDLVQVRMALSRKGSSRYDGGGREEKKEAPVKSMLDDFGFGGENKVPNMLDGFGGAPSMLDSYEEKKLPSMLDGYEVKQEKKVPSMLDGFDEPPKKTAVKEEAENDDGKKEEPKKNDEKKKEEKKPTMFKEPDASSILDSFGF